MKTLIRNIGQIVSGDIRRPLLDGDALVLDDGRITGIGRGLDENADTDLVVCDAPVGSVGNDALSALAAGDLPGISMVFIDGRITIGRSRNTPPAARAAEIVRGHGPAAGGH